VQVLPLATNLSNELYKNTDHTLRLIGGLYASLEALRGLKLRLLLPLILVWKKYKFFSRIPIKKLVSEGKLILGDNRSQGYTQVLLYVSYERTIKEHFL
jgi:hypothetical protein